MELRFDFQYYDIPENIKKGIDVYKEIVSKTFFSPEREEKVDEIFKKLSLEIDDSYISVKIISNYIEPIIDIVNKAIENRNYMQIAKAYANCRVRKDMYGINDTTECLDKKAVVAANYNKKTEDLFELLMEYNSFQNYPSPNYLGIKQLYEEIKNQDKPENNKEIRWDFLFAANLHNASRSQECNNMLNYSYMKMNDSQKQLIDDALRIRNNTPVCDYTGHTGIVNIFQTTNWIIEKHSLYNWRREKMLKNNSENPISIEDRVERINENFQSNKKLRMLYD